MSEVDVEDRFCWRCLILALLPLIGLIAVGWWATQQLEFRRLAADNASNALVEEIEDLESENAALQNALESSRRLLDDARAVARQADQWTFDDIVDRVLAMPTVQRKRLLERMGIVEQGLDLDALRKRIAALPRRQQDAFWRALPANRDLRAWLASLSDQRRQDWVAALPLGADPDLSDLREARAALDKSERSLAAEQRRRIALEREREVLQAEAAALRQERDSLEIALEQARRGVDRRDDAPLIEARAAAKELSALRQRVELAETSMVEASVDAAAMSDALARERDANSALRDALEQARAEADGLVGATTRRAAIGHTEIIGARGGELSALRQELDDARSRIEVMRLELDDARRETLRLDAARDDLSRRLRERLGGDDIDDAAIRLSTNIAFRSASATLSPAGRRALDQVAREIRDELDARPSDVWRLVVEGHTDRRPIRKLFKSNWELSAARAAAVARYLGGEGVPEDRIVVRARAAFDPIDPRDTVDAYAANRRIEFEIAPR